MKPYAWINVNDEYKILFDDELPTLYPEAWMPLYANPAKELTDDEIKSVWNKMVCSVHMTGAELDFAKAILKKAQE